MENARHIGLIRGGAVMLTAVACVLALAACTGEHKSNNTSSESEAPISGSSISAPVPSTSSKRIRAVVETFGKRLRQVSTLAPLDDVRRAIQDSYADLVTPELLEAWLGDPRSAPGKRVSSPWPQNIDINDIRCASTHECRVTGDVRYVTSVEMAHGGTAATRSIVLDFRKTRKGWRINRVSLGEAAPVQSSTAGVDTSSR